ncbi:MAG: hypothetical protein JNN12_07925 [Bacteroidetes Order II. Incertae sedis bacterium]|nr:hypothetical protein [Bacteroidetes Order II. bacterium]
MMFFAACTPTESTPSTDGSVTLYAVTTGADSTFAAEPLMEPIVVLKGGNFEKPIPNLPENSTTEAFDQALNKAISRFFPANGKFSLYIGGVLSGKVQITANNEGEGGDSAGLANPVKIITNALNAERFAIAANSEQFNAPGRKTRKLTSQEEQAILPLARSAFSENGVSPALLDSIQTQAIRVYDLNGKGVETVIGDFIIEHRSSSVEGEATISRELLFVIAEKVQGNFVMRVSAFGSSGEFATEDSQMIDLIDVLDVDGDGVFEVIARRNMAESYDFAIYKKQGNDWRVAYQGGGGGVAN